ncbi:putative ferric-chelate reductase 1 isoform X3 [Pagrus major]|uniref:putative ferric-chelate reductase 1 isoform X3 n=1 Tax=Pagrus major TaxID=143350 RepID=UPI003CC8444F
MSPADVCCLLFISVLACCWVPSGCYANGKVTKVCGSMEPHHRGSGETTPSPYSLETNTTTFSPTDRIQVILSGTTYFEGFLLEARDAGNQSSASAVGTFTLTDLQGTQLLTCNKHQGSAVSHTSDVRQTEVVVVWTAPTDSPSEVQFFVTVVAHYNKFWVKLPGPIIYQHGVPPLPPQPDTTPPPVPTSTASLLPAPSVVFELSGPAEGYVSFALSWDTWMGNDDVYMCVKDGDRVSVSAAFVSGRTHPEDESQSGLSSVSWRLADGAIQCRFRRPVKLANQEAARYDLAQEYFVFGASGHAEHGSVWKHSRQPLISTQRKLITGPPEVLTGSRGPIIMKMHGALMLVAWMLTGSVGTFIASFYKPDWPNHSLLGQKIWFQVHRGLMVLTVTLTIVAFCLPFFYRKGWSKHAGVHPYLGCCVLALSLIQPIMAVIRPSPDSHRRYIFNWAHWGVGSVTEIIAVAAMFLGTSQSSLLLPQPLATHVLIGYVTWLASFRVLLLVHKHLYIKNSALVSDDTQGILCDQSVRRRWDSFIKPVLLAVVALGNAGLLMALLSFIAEI